jgi:hypothetical protein
MAVTPTPCFIIFHLTALGPAEKDCAAKAGVEHRVGSTIGSATKAKAM